MESAALRRVPAKPGLFQLGLVGLLFAFDQSTAALVLGAVLVGVCGLVTATNYCIPSTLLGLWWRRRGIDPATT